MSMSYLQMIYTNLLFFVPCFIYRLPVVNDCPAGQTARVTSNLHSSSSSTMAVSRVPSPPLAEVNTPVAENWCYTQVSERQKNHDLTSCDVLLYVWRHALNEP